MKNRVCVLVLTSFILLPISSVSHAGPLRWIKEGAEYLFDSTAKKQARQEAIRQSRARAKREAIEQRSKQVVREQTLANVSKATTAFQIGAYTFTGVLVADFLYKAGYSENPIPAEQEEVTTTVATFAGEEADTYQEKFCIHPANGNKYIVPVWANFCSDGSEVQYGNGIDLEALRVASL